MADDLEVLAPASVQVTVRGELLDIQPLTVGHLPALVRLARPVIDALMALDADTLDALAAADASQVLAGDNDALAMLMGLVGDHGEALIEATAWCIDRKPEWVRRADLVDFITLVQAVIGVNRDFFTQRLAPLLASRGGATRANGAGPTLSSS